MLKLYKALKELGVLSLSKRNLNYIMRYNNRSLYPIVDNKLKTKKIAIEHGISVPELYGVVETPHEIDHFQKIVGEHNDFVIKPACGCGGDGIIVVTDRVKDFYRLANGRLVKLNTFDYHLNNTLNGVYSLGGHSDIALIEQRVIVDPVFNSVSTNGVPDIRVITLLGYPVMAMVRLPTHHSDGKANLHQGAIGAGINISSGKTLLAVWHNEIIEFHPDTLNEISGLTVPYWDDVLAIAASCYELTGLGYLGIDIVLDKHRGPLMLELNARPGLNIQIANQAGLLTRLQLIEKHVESYSLSATDRIKFSQERFAD